MRRLVSAVLDDRSETALYRSLSFDSTGVVATEHRTD
jgi:hypothetical protein